ncbi:hypothetical protein FGO68_gene5186 [Halteria grandinella]|uniref:Transmembrane protein n=1 Tax=Halteria grandinella TaxID=5974 RepID=A0A8J8T4A6_HALGN|nr:hypothetical protein FGO68_gene5186 [Halteria grandinella]
MTEWQRFNQVQQIFLTETPARSWPNSAVVYLTSLPFWLWKAIFSSFLSLRLSLFSCFRAFLRAALSLFSSPPSSFSDDDSSASMSGPCAALAFFFFLPSSLTTVTSSAMSPSIGTLNCLCNSIFYLLTLTTRETVLMTPGWLSVFVQVDRIDSQSHFFSCASSSSELSLSLVSRSSSSFSIISFINRDFYVLLPLQLLLGLLLGVELYLVLVLHHGDELGLLALGDHELVEQLAVPQLLALYELVHRLVEGILGEQGVRVQVHVPVGVADLVVGVLAVEALLELGVVQFLVVALLVFRHLFSLLHIVFLIFLA